jgi:acyl carrier protein
MPHIMSGIATDIRAYVIDRFLFGDTSAALSNSESLLEQGTVDSTGVLELVMFLEDRFGIKVHDDELVPENLESIEKTADFVQRKLT